MDKSFWRDVLLNSRIKEKTDSYCSYDLYECRKRKSNLPEVRHQKEAIMACEDWLESKNHPSGTILALPTGSGKTFTAVRFLCKYPLSDGYKVLWLAHTHHLLEQAFFSFGPGKMEKKEKYEVGWVLESEENPKEKLNIRVVSGSSKHSDVIDIKNTDDIIIATLQSIQRAYSNPTKSEKILDFLKSSNGKVFVVFDEAHHAPAPSFRKMLIGDDSDSKIPKSIRELFPEMCLLGLTATPTYTDLKKRGWLMDIFPQGIINADSKKFHSSINDLIHEDILAEPNPVEIKTKCDPEIDDREYSLLAKREKKDIPERIIKRLAENRERNQTIVNNYDKKTYGKTIIFTDYIDQCEQINNFLREKSSKLSGDDKFSSDVMYSARADEENERVLEKFRNDELDVIVNVRKLTEGTDVPDVNSVFVTRQTTSEILLTQMVGRALRGPRFGGTKVANLVFFTDDWKKLINWAAWDTESWSGTGEVEEYHSGPWDLISVALVRWMIKVMGSGGNNNGDYLRYMPVGWYVVDYYDNNGHEKNDEGEPLKVRDFVLVFENDQEYYSNMIKHFKESNIGQYNDENIKLNDFEIDIGYIMDKYFPNPDKHIGKGLKMNIFKIARHMAQDKKNPPLFVPFRERKNYDMDVLAQKFMRYDRVLENQKLKEVYNQEDSLWKTLYYDYDHFKSQYNACVEWLLSKNNSDDDKGNSKSTEEEILVGDVHTGTRKELIAALKKLGEMGSNEYLYKSTIDLIHSLSRNSSDLRVQKAAKDTFAVIKRDLFPEERGLILRRDHYTCLCCGESDRGLLQVDHIMPRSMGGSHSPENLQTLCGKCNGGVKSEEIVDFRSRISPLSKPISEFYGLGNRYINQKQTNNPDFWEKLIKRNVNLFYRCRSVKDVYLDLNEPEWYIELYKGNDPQWAERCVTNLVLEIKSKFGEFDNNSLFKKINFKLTDETSDDIPEEYTKLWKKYVRGSYLLNDEEKDKLALYMNKYGLI